MDLTIEGKAYINKNFQNCCIGIDNGKIIEIKKILKSNCHLDFGNKLIIPAAIDIHVHFREPGMTHKEDFSTGSMAAACGGVSCVFDMPNTVPQTISLQDVKDKIDIAGKKSYVDFGIYAGVTNNNIKNIDSLATKASGFKIYLGGSTNALTFDKKNLRQALEKTSFTKKPTMFHAEDQEMLSRIKGVENNLVDHQKFRPAGYEVNSIRDVFNASRGLNSKIHICHVSSIEALELLKNRPSNMSFGLTPHHCLLKVDKNICPQTFYKVNPPIRSDFDREALFNALKNQTAGVIESDHAPHTKDEKEVVFDKAPSGMPGVETMLPIFLHMAKKELISFQAMFSLCSENPAKLFDLSKGRIEAGADADLAVVDIKDETKIKSENLHSKCRWSAFEGWKAIFPKYVFIRGEKVIDNNEIQVSQGFGKFIGE